MWNDSHSKFTLTFITSHSYNLFSLSRELLRFTLLATFKYTTHYCQLGSSCRVPHPQTIWPPSPSPATSLQPHNWSLFLCLFQFIFHVKGRSYGICLSLPAWLHLALEQVYCHSEGSYNVVCFHLLSNIFRLRITSVSQLAIDSDWNECGRTELWRCYDLLCCLGGFGGLCIRQECLWWLCTCTVGWGACTWEGHMSSGCTVCCANPLEGDYWFRAKSKGSTINRH